MLIFGECCQPATDYFDAYSTSAGNKDLGFKDGDVWDLELDIDY